MSCFGKTPVYQIALGEVLAFPIRFLEIDLAGAGVTLLGKILTPDNVFVDDVEFELMNQTINAGVVLMRFDSSLWPENLLGLTLKFDVVLSIDNTLQPDTKYSSGVMYLEVLDSPTLRATGV